jgi:hypothetical protein
MSIRAAKAARDTHAAIVGEAVGSPIGGFWSRLLVNSTPPSTPPSAPTAAPTISSLILAAHEETTAAEVAAAAVPSKEEEEEGPPTLISVFPSHLYELPKCSIMTFRQASDTVQIAEFPRRIMCKDSVIGIPATVDAIAWSELEAPEGAVGHVFSLSNEGRAVCKVEATLRDGELERLAVVQANYSPLLVAAGFVPPSSLLVFSKPKAHLAALRALHADLAEDEELGYMPTSELIVTKAVKKLKLDAGDGKKAAAARHDWQTTLDFLCELSTATADCADRYAHAEVERTRAHELRAELKTWRRHVV